MSKFEEMFRGTIQIVVTADSDLTEVSEKFQKLKNLADEIVESFPKDEAAATLEISQTPNVMAEMQKRQRQQQQDQQIPDVGFQPNPSQYL